MGQWYPPTNALLTEKRKLDRRNETAIVFDLTNVSMNTPSVTPVPGASQHSGTRKHRLAGFAHHVSFPIILKQSPSHSSLELVKQGLLSPFD